MVEQRRANFKTHAKVTEEELKSFESNQVVKSALEKGNPMLDIPVSETPLQLIRTGDIQPALFYDL